MKIAKVFHLNLFFLKQGIIKGGIIEGAMNQFKYSAQTNTQQSNP